MNVLLGAISIKWMVRAYKAAFKKSNFFLNFKKLKFRLKLYNFGKSEEEFEDFPASIRKKLSLFWVTKKNDIVSIAKRIRRRKIFKALNYVKSKDFFELKFNFYYNIQKFFPLNLKSFLIESTYKKKKDWVKISRVKKNNLSLNYFFDTYIRFSKTISIEDLKYLKNIDIYWQREKLLLVHYYNPYRLLNNDLSLYKTNISKHKVLTKYLINNC
jgi:hypothetical protein